MKDCTLVKASPNENWANGPVATFVMISYWIRLQLSSQISSMPLILWIAKAISAVANVAIASS